MGNIISADKITLRSVQLLTSSEWEANSTQKIIGGDLVIVPNSELKGAFTQFKQWYIVVHEGVIPDRVRRSTHHRRFLFTRLVSIWQQVAEK